jgi:hypothetical protein
LIEQWLSDLGGGNGPVIQGTADLVDGEVPHGLPNIRGINEDWPSVAVFVADINGVGVIARGGRGILIAQTRGRRRDTTGKRRRGRSP